MWYREGEYTYLICMWCRDEDYGTLSWHLPGSSRMDFTKEEVDEDGHGPEDEVVEPWDHTAVALARAGHFGSGSQFDGSTMLDM